MIDSMSHHAGRNAKLYINEAFVNFISTKPQELDNLVSDHVANITPIDGVTLQMQITEIAPTLESTPRLCILTRHFNCKLKFQKQMSTYSTAPCKCKFIALLFKRRSCRLILCWTSEISPCCCIASISLGEV